MDDIIEHLAYDRMVEKALRGVLREALEITLRQGLPGEHHFYITFDTNHPDTVLSPRLKSQHPEAMTIVLQNQFWDLEVRESFFAVVLSFGGIRERLVIPFEAVSAFADPHASFGLQFQTGVVLEDEEDEDDDLFPDPVAEDDQDGVDAQDGVTAPEDNVITLDTFRKKP
ncbi:SspB family protein [Rhodospirillum sp. A1_3_36]|uniref:SspB family protein n=1 Tax=Rhodospirillum sp. A1_3_36 TaxID=3391666 RepID=UPI0039A691DB